MTKIDFSTPRLLVFIVHQSILTNTPFIHHFFKQCKLLFNFHLSIHDQIINYFGSIPIMADCLEL